jgi:hypothetical protein
VIALLDRDAFRSVPESSEAVKAAAVRLSAYGSAYCVFQAVSHLEEGLGFHELL